MIADFKSRVHVPIQEVENSLLQIAQNIGIQIVSAYVSDPDRLSESFPETEIFIGSDGAHSDVRGKVFGDDARLDATIQRLIQVTYEIDEARPRMDFRLKSGGLIEHSFSTIASMSTTLVDERHSKRRTTTQKILTFAVNDKSFQNMKRATFSSPFTLRTPNLPDELKQDFYLWCGMKEEVYGEVRILDSEKFTGIDGKARIAQSFVKGLENGKVWCLLGDAAASFPLQRGFNVGLKCGIGLATAVSNYYTANEFELIRGDGIDGAVHRAFKHYADLGKDVENQELCFLHCPLDQKKRGINFWKFVTDVLPGLDNATKSRYLQIGKAPGKTPMGQMPATRDRMTQMVADYKAVQMPQGIPVQQNLTPLERMQMMLQQYRG